MSNPLTAARLSKSAGKARRPKKHLSNNFGALLALQSRLFYAASAAV
jgi:hypothetical protein